MLGEPALAYCTAVISFDARNFNTKLGRYLHTCNIADHSYCWIYLLCIFNITKVNNENAWLNNNIFNKTFMKNVFRSVDGM